MGRLIDITGEKFGNLTVIKRNGHYKKDIKWLCECKCGNMVNSRAADLKDGKMLSCGCWFKTNKYNIKSDYIECIMKDGNIFIFDIDDFETVKKYTWHASSESYIQTTVNKKTIKLHRLVMNAKDNEYIDHINHDKFDNRKENLRKCTNAENCRNKGLYKNNTSGVTGVIWNNKNNCWECRITINGKRIYLGCFNLLEDAKKVREQAEIKYFGEYRFKGGK